MIRMHVMKSGGSSRLSSLCSAWRQDTAVAAGVATVVACSSRFLHAMHAVDLRDRSIVSRAARRPANDDAIDRGRPLPRP